MSDQKKGKQGPALFLRNTPVWVWILLAFLLRRGFAALYDREMTTGRMFFLPMFFLVWGAYGVITETELAGTGLTMMAAEDCSQEQFLDTDCGAHSHR
ncbi:hypothetical protein [Salmonella enterica]|uniref:hypothetical protein n=1 Tax=Salmonella enterica TaxID=28901 RepID=UPI0018E0B0FA|nr:hypothetical protein [Salmonella enterica]